MELGRVEIVLVQSRTEGYNVIGRGDRSRIDRYILAVHIIDKGLFRYTGKQGMIHA